MAEEFRFGVVGAFSGSRAGTRPDPVHEVDRDDLDALFARLAPRVTLGLDFCAELELDAFEQLHPDHLVDRVPALASLLAAHRAAENPARFRTLAGEAGLGAQIELEPPPDFSRSARAALRPGPPSGGAGLLDEIHGGRPPGASARARDGSDPELARILDEVASPHAERVDHAGTRARRGAIEAALAERLRAILHHPELRRLEASWRSLRQLVRSSETGESLRIFAIDVPTSDAAQGELRRLVEERARAEDGFALLLLDREVEDQEADLALLSAVGGIAGAGRLRCLLGAGRSLWDLERATSFLSRARGLPGADRIALCGPRVLQRPPYGRNSEPVERFAFEEIPTEGAQEALLWGNGAFVLAQALLDAIAAAGTPAAAPRFALREGLPMHTTGPGSPAGPTDLPLPEVTADRFRDLGLAPLMGIRKRDALLVTGFRSLTGAPLFGD